MNEINNAYVSDKYQYTMGKSYLDCGKEGQIAVFNLFYRKAPENNNWAVVSGTEEVIEMVLKLGTEPEEFYEKFLPGEEYKEFRKYLSTMKFTGDVYTMREGEIVFPNQPIVTVVGPLVEAQVLETPMLCILNHQMAVATKASRVCRSTDKPVSEFGSRFMAARRPRLPAAPALPTSSLVRLTACLPPAPWRTVSSLPMEAP